MPDRPARNLAQGNANTGKKYTIRVAEKDECERKPEGLGLVVKDRYHYYLVYAESFTGGIEVVLASTLVTSIPPAPTSAPRSFESHRAEYAARASVALYTVFSIS